MVRRLRVEQPDDFAGLQAELALDPSEPDEWDRAAEHMYVPHDPTAAGSPRRTPRSSPTSAGTSPTSRRRTFPLLLHHHPLTMYRRQVLKQADVVMAMFLLGNEFTAEQKRRNFDYYDPITTGDSSLSASIQSIVASEIGDEEAACGYLDLAAADGPRRRRRQRLRRCAHRLGGGWLDGARVRLRRRPRLRRPARPSTLACRSGSGRSAFSLRFHDRQLRIRLTHDWHLLAGSDGRLHGPGGLFDRQ